MKKLIGFLLMLFLLAGCQSADTEQTSLPPDTTVPALSWVEESGIPWDQEGALVELPLTIPNGFHYSGAFAFDGDLLLFSWDNHRADFYALELCVVELDSGMVSAQREIETREMIYPQILGDGIYLCDNVSGQVIRLDKSLNIAATWQTEPTEGSWNMGGNETIYVNNWDGSGYILDLNTGEKSPILPDDLEFSYMIFQGDFATVEYYHPDSGAANTGLLDVWTGDFQTFTIPHSYMSMEQMNGTWLCGTYGEQHIYYLQTGDDPVQMAEMGMDTLKFTEDGRILRIWENGTRLSLHDLSGRALAQCTVSEREYTATSAELIYDESRDGYFCLLSNYDSGHRLLFWDPSKGEPGEDLSFVPVPEPTEEERLLRESADRLSQKYGVSILLGTQCETEFGDFTADHATNYVDVSFALEILDEALSSYPEGFFRQLRYDTIHSVEIQLVSGLRSVDLESRPGSYSAFARQDYEKHLVVVDIDNSSQQTYYHEFSHVIDCFLLWDANQREDALFSEETWASFNPSWFEGYTYDYSFERELKNYRSFIDSYSTISPTEDRARVLEYAMVEYYDNFDGNQGLQKKLDYYCRCIRDAFDTTNWPKTLLWEQYL